MSEEEKKGRSRKQPKEEPQETSLGKEILSWLQIIVAAVVIAFVLNNFVIANSRIPTGSMENYHLKFIVTYFALQVNQARSCY